MASQRTPEEHSRGLFTSAFNSEDHVGCYYLHYQADRPMKYDIAFRRFIISTILNDGAHLVPVRFGPGRKLTSEGVVKVLGTCIVPTTCKYQESVIEWTQIPLPVYEKYRIAAATKVYFRGFPLDASQQDVANTFRVFGNLQYVYLMCDSVNKTRSNKQGYVIFEYRDSVERLFSINQPLYFKGFPIHYEEYKSKKPNLMKNEQNPVNNWHSLENHENPAYFHYKGSYLFEATPTSCSDPKRSLFGPLGKNGANPGLQKYFYNEQDVYNYSELPTKAEVVTSPKFQSLLKPILRFKSYIESNTSKIENVRFNRPSLNRDFGNRHATAYALNQRNQLAY